MRLRPKDGFDWNPLLSLPRNMPCPCGSGRKFKLCHLLTLPKAIPFSMAAQYRKVVKQADEIHFTHDPKKPEGVNEDPIPVA